MKVIITADWHFGHPGRLTDLANAFETLIQYCCDNNIKVIIIAGDLTHDRESMTHDVSNTIHLLFEKANSFGLSIITLIGNHDMFYRHKWSINAIRPFAKQITYVDKISYFELEDRKFWMIPFIEHESFYMKVVKDVSKLASKDDVLITHIGIASAAMNNCFLVQNWNSVSFEETIFNRVYAGHFHNHQKVGSKSWYTGSPIPFRFDEGLVEHGFIVYDTHVGEHDFVNISDLMDEKVKPPDYITVDSDDIDNIKEHIKNTCVRIVLKDGDDKEEIRNKIPDAHKIVFVSPKEKKPDFSDKSEQAIKTNDMFKSWVEYDKPEHLSKDFLLSLEKEIRSESRFISDD